PTVRVLLTGRHLDELDVRPDHIVLLGAMSMTFREAVIEGWEEAFGIPHDALFEALGYAPGDLRIAERFVGDLVARLEAITAHDFEGPGLVGPDGRPLAAAAAEHRAIITDVRAIDAELYKVLAADPSLMYRLDSRKFEEMVADLMERQGYEV